MRSNGGDSGFADTLKQHTWDWHRQAERSDLIYALLQGRVNRDDYALFLRNLLPVYAQLEAALTQPSLNPALRWLACPEVYRAPAIVNDLIGLYGEDWEQGLPLLAEGQAYAQRIADLAGTGSEALIGHAYVRYLGDLNGGRIVGQRLQQSLGLEPEALTFYNFPAIADLNTFRSQYRAGFDHAVAVIQQPEVVLAEAGLAFQLNIALSNVCYGSAERLALARL